jgi:hypothetical protein
MAFVGTDKNDDGDTERRPGRVLGQQTVGWIYRSADRSDNGRRPRCLVDMLVLLSGSAMNSIQMNQMNQLEGESGCSPLILYSWLSFLPSLVPSSTAARCPPPQTRDKKKIQFYSTHAEPLSLLKLFVSHHPPINLQFYLAVDSYYRAINHCSHLGIIYNSISQVRPD